MTSSFLAITPRAADVLPAGCSEVDLQIAGTNTFAKNGETYDGLVANPRPDQTPLQRVRLATKGPEFFSSGDLYALRLNYRRGVGARSDVEALLTWNVLAGGGFADRIIEDFHNTFSLGNDVRHLFPPNLGLTYIRTSRGELVYNASRYNYSTLVLSGTRELLETKHVVVSGRLLVKAPLFTSGFASRSIDEGAELLWRGNFRFITVHASVAAIHVAANSRLLTGSKTSPTYTLEGVVPIFKRTALVGQIIRSQSATATLPFTEFHRPSSQFSGGFRTELSPRSLLSFNITEHVLYFENTSDVGLNVTLSWRP